MALHSRAPIFLSPIVFAAAFSFAADLDRTDDLKIANPAAEVRETVTPQANKNDRQTLPAETTSDPLATATKEGRFVRLDPRFDEIFPADAKLEIVADGFTWVEGPAWRRSQGYLLFSEIPANAIHKWQEGKGTEIFLQPSGYTGTEPFTGYEPGSNGLVFDAEERLVMCEHGDRRVARLEADGTKATLADRYEGKRLNSPNDLVYKSNGDLYFTDPPYGLPQTFDDPTKELDFNGVYRLSPDGELTLLTDTLQAPNGIAFSPDEKTLYLSDSERGLWLAYDVLADGTLANERLLYDASALLQRRKGAPDGMTIDTAGNLYAAGPEALYVLAPDGTLLGTVETGIPTGNATWGDRGSTLYVAASAKIYRIHTNAKGLKFH